jgi:hypothetical protein
MEYLCTICCKDKRTDPELLPAIERYISERIQFVYQESLQSGTPMLIFSGKYGLLAPSDMIPWYDRKLILEAVPNITLVLSEHLRQKAVSRLIFYCHPKTDADWYPYHLALEGACAGQNTAIIYQFVDME